MNIAQKIVATVWLSIPVIVGLERYGNPRFFDGPGAAIAMILMWTLIIGIPAVVLMYIWGREPRKII